MKYKINYTTNFWRDYKRMKKRGKNMSKLQNIVMLLANGEQLDIRYRTHQLKGNYEGVMECHIEPDWLLTWIADNDKLALLFTGTGSHSDLF